jgi:phthiocerol/phenolphthiocerol synthesis type-I polyketide synthase E
VQTLSSAGDDQSDLALFHGAFAALWESGTEPRWTAFAGQGRRTTLPTYPFQRKRYWMDDAAAPRGAGPEVPAPAPVRPSSRQNGGQDGQRTPLEAELNGVFRRVLGAEHIGPTDNFFALGGNSLLALDLVEQVRRDHQVKIPLRDFFSAPTVQGLAGLVDAAERHDHPAAIGENAGD